MDIYAALIHIRSVFMLSLSHSPCRKMSVTTVLVTESLAKRRRGNLKRSQGRVVLLSLSRPPFFSALSLLMMNDTPSSFRKSRRETAETFLERTEEGIEV